MRKFSISLLLVLVLLIVASQTSLHAEKSNNSTKKVIEQGEKVELSSEEREGLIQSLNLGEDISTKDKNKIENLDDAVLLEIANA